MSTLNQQHCRILQGAEYLLPVETCQQHLAELNQWHLIENGSALQKTVPFENYYQTMAFVNALAFMAHREDHHPDLGVHYNRCVIRYSTHDVGGLSLNDFICAAKVDALLAG